MSLLKTPIDLAEVRIGVVSTCTMAGTIVTDHDGRMNFTSDDVGAPIWIIGAADPIADVPDNGMLRTVVVAVNSPTEVETADAATQTADASSNTTLFRKRGAPKINTAHSQTSLTTHDTFSCSFLDTLDPPLTLQPILYIVDGHKEFGGLIMKVKAVEIEGNEAYMEWQLECVGWEVLVYGRTTGEPTDPDSIIAQPNAGTFDNALPSAIIKYLIVNALSSEGFDFVPNAEGVAIPSFQVSYAPCGNAFDNVITSATQGTPPQWLHWFCSPDKKIVLADDTSTPAPFDITDDAPSDDYRVGFELDEDGDTFVNRVIIREGNQVSDPVPESYPGDGSTKSFNLLTPLAGEPTIKVNGTPKSVGIQGTNTGKDWYWNLNSTTITQDTGGTPLTSGDTIEITGPRFQNGFATYYNTDAIQMAQERQSGTGYHEIVQQQDNPLSLVDGETYARAVGQQLGVIPKRITIKTFRSGLALGQSIQVTRSRWGLDSTFVIDSLTITTDGAWVIFEATAIGSPLVDYDYRATLARLRPPDGNNGGGGGAPGPQAFWRVFDIHNTATGTNVGPVLTVQEGGAGIKITAVLRTAITADLVVRVNANAVELGTITVPLATPVNTEVAISIQTKRLVKGQPITWDIVASDGSFNPNGVATVTVLWGLVNQVSVMGDWKGEYSPSATYDQGDTVQFDGSSYLSLQDENNGNEPDPLGSDWWDLVAIKGDDGAAGTGVPTGGTTGQVLTKLSGTDYDADWEDISEVITTKGDLETFDTAVTRLPVGSDGDVLAADSGEATGLKWTPTTVEVQGSGIAIGTRHALNFIANGGGITIAIVDDPANGRVNIYISGSGGGSSSAGSSAMQIIGFGLEGQ
jgi:hypothetical protein